VRGSKRVGAEIGDYLAGGIEMERSAQSAQNVCSSHRRKPHMRLLSLRSTDMPIVPPIAAGAAAFGFTLFQSGMKQPTH
jgi:hypothetical protein